MDALIVVADGFEDSEFFYPYYRLLEAGFGVDVATPGVESVEGEHGYSREADLSVDEADEERYDLLVIPGGKSPEHLRIEAPRSAALAREFDDADKKLAAICHGPQILMSAGVLEGRDATCYPSIRDDLENAGANFVDEPAVVDGNLVTSRSPDDLPDFMAETIRAVGADR
ncbi:MAG: Deglycase [Methanonatronarchaeales archaeon]|nr:Deglycase [Methanonatronarchaeales archaeon]